MKDILEGYYRAVIDLYDSRDEDTKVPLREIQEREFILGEMLKIAALLDYSDRFGAVKILSLMSECVPLVSLYDLANTSQRSACFLRTDSPIICCHSASTS